MLGMFLKNEFTYSSLTYTDCESAVMDGIRMNKLYLIVPNLVECLTRRQQEWEIRQL